MTELKTETEAREFWAKLDEKTRLVLANTAPVVATSWEQSMDSTSTTWLRCMHGDTHVARINQWHGEEEWEVSGGLMSWGSYSSLESAKAACDAKLRELGFVLEGS